IMNTHASFIPKDLDINWSVLQPLFTELLNRPITSKAALEAWMADRSALDSVLEEDFAWRYIHMTCDTASKEKLDAFQYFAQEIEPKIAPLNNQLNKKLIASEFTKELDPETYGIYLRGVRKSLELFRKKNVPLQTEIQITQQKYQAVTGAMSIVLDEKE